MKTKYNPSSTQKASISKLVLFLVDKISEVMVYYICFYPVVVTLEFVGIPYTALEVHPLSPRSVILEYSDRMSKNPNRKDAQAGFFVF